MAGELPGGGDAADAASNDDDVRFGVHVRLAPELMGTWQRVTVVTACSLSGIVFWEKGFPLVSPRIFSRLMDMTLRWWLPYASREFVIREQGEGTPRVARGGLLPHPPPLRSLPDSAPVSYTHLTLPTIL